MALTYTYSNGAISHYALKRVWGNCHVDESKTTLIGVMCKHCKHYLGINGKYVLCEYHKQDDDPEITGAIRAEIYESIRDEAIRYMDW